MTTTKPWQLAKWRERREECLKGKVCTVCSSKEKLVIHHPQERNALTDEEYASFDGAVVLCSRCHFLLHKYGRAWPPKILILCKKCKKNRHNSRYELCYQCNKEEEERYEELVKVKTPCGEEHEISRLAYEVMGAYEVCHECEKLQECHFIPAHERA